ncbi:MAG: U3 snoRNP protein [Pleopsidium flavum]|nr:MAG: U3 snoRNP protein [Pleopsidium flavum]
MAGASDKARFYLEQSVPELQEYERKNIFTKVPFLHTSSGTYLTTTKEEITSIAKKRSDFEHKINARGSQPSDYARYAGFEMNLESLRRKRVKRLGVKITGHAGKRRIFFVLDRATRKFHGDIALWMQYIEYARKEKANKKLSQILTSVLRLHPTKPELWIYAARYAVDAQADMTEARSYMQRGLRFCKTSKALWLEYAKLEMIYIAKIAARRRILGLDEDQTRRSRVTPAESPDADMLTLPTVTAEDINPHLQPDDSVDQAALQTLDSTPALTGAIPLAIFDAAMKQFPSDGALGERFFDMFAEFAGVPCLARVLEHVVNSLLAASPTSPEALSCFIRQPVIAIDATAAAFPSALGISLKRLKSSMQLSEPKWKLSDRVVNWLLLLQGIKEHDPGVRKVLSVTLSQAVHDFSQAAMLEGSFKESDLVRVVKALQEAGYQNEVRSLVASGLERWSTNDQIRALEMASD